LVSNILNPILFQLLVNGKLD